MRRKTYLLSLLTIGLLSIAAPRASGQQKTMAPAEFVSWLPVTEDVDATRFAQNMQNRLYVVRPGLLASGGDYFLPSKERSSPVKLEADLRHDLVRIKIPSGYKVDEVPAPVNIGSPYGSLEASWVVNNGEIVMEQTLEVKEK